MLSSVLLLRFPIRPDRENFSFEMNRKRKRKIRREGKGREMQETDLTFILWLLSVFWLRAPCYKSKSSSVHSPSIFGKSCPRVSRTWEDYVLNLSPFHQFFQLYQIVHNRKMKNNSNITCSIIFYDHPEQYRYSLTPSVLNGFMGIVSSFLTSFGFPCLE